MFPLLKTKLFVPSVRPELVARPRLVSRLNAVFGPDDRFARTLTLVSAPAGYGKTTLLTEWIAGARECQSRAPAFCWLSLDVGDNDPARFWAYLIAALQTADPDLGQGTLALLQPSGGIGFPVQGQTEALLTSLINDITDSSKRLILILDDYHLIDEAAIHKGITFLVDHCPSQLHVVISTRADPPLSLSRLRARNQLVEVRAADLCFVAEETRDFLCNSMHLTLSADEVAVLGARVEGWATGLQMAALALRAQDKADLLTSLAQTQRYVLDYLADEVFSQQTQEVQDFLLRTSILDRLCASLCDAVLKEDGTPSSYRSSSLILEKLEKANLFVTLLDGREAWYRYHPLFADLLQRRLAQVAPESAPQLHLRASRWYEAHGLIGKAVDHALAASDFERTADLVDAHAKAMLMRSENATVLRWIEALPDDLVLARPSLCLYQAWAMLLIGRAPEMVETRLRTIELSESSSNDVQGAASAVRSLLATLQGRIDDGARFAQQALDQLPESSAFLRSIAANNLGMIYVMRGDIVAAEPVFDQVVALAQRTGNVMMVVVALCNLAGLHIVRGELRRAEVRYKHALALSTDPRGRRLPVAARALIGLGELRREWNDLDAAERALYDALDLCTRYAEIGSLVCYLTLSRVRSARGDEAGALDMLEQAQSIASASRTTQMDDRLVAAARARIWIARGQLDKATTWVRDAELENLSPASYDLREAELLILARLYLAQKRPVAGLAQLRRLHERDAQQGRSRRLIEILGLEALALHQQDEETRATSLVREALTLAEPEGYVRTFLDEGPSMAALLLKVRQVEVDSVLVPYINRLLAAFADVADLEAALHPASDTQPLIEPLSERELEVLDLLSAGHSNREIAAQLYISLSTVKGHTSSIYGKLGARNRTQAVARARALGVLTD